MFSSKPRALMKKFGSIDFLMLFFKRVNINCKLNGIDLDWLNFKLGIVSSLLSVLLEQVGTVEAVDIIISSLSFYKYNIRLIFDNLFDYIPES